LPSIYLPRLDGQTDKAVTVCFPLGNFHSWWCLHVHLELKHPIKHGWILDSCYWAKAWTRIYCIAYRNSTDYNSVNKKGCWEMDWTRSWLDGGICKYM